LRELRTLFNLGAIGELTDGQLLERFATQSPESAELAFAALVERHGPMVLRVCQSALRDRHQADDAFQATFLVLVQQARSLWVKDSLGPWLHRVAHRIATRTRHSEARRRDQERRAAAMNPRVASEPDNPNEHIALLHDEIDRLPERYRVPIVICDLQGFTHEKAARHLGWPLGTVKSRLARAREILRGRLSRRGLELHAGLLIAGQGPPAALRALQAVLPQSLAESTVAAATGLVSGGAAGAISTSVIILVEQGLKSMLLNKLKLASIVLLFLGAAGATTVGVLAQSGLRSKPEPVKETNSPASAVSRDGRSGDSTSSADPVPAHITQSRVMIVTRLEDELAEARARLDRTRKRAGAHATTDPAVRHAQNTVDALDKVLARIDAVLVDAVDAYPTIFDFSRGPGPLSSVDQPLDDSTFKPARVRTDPLADQSLEVQLARARDRLQWADEMYKRGYVSRSVVALEQKNVSRLTALLESKPAEKPDNQKEQPGENQARSKKPDQPDNNPSEQGRKRNDSQEQPRQNQAPERKNPGQPQNDANRPEQAPDRNSQNGAGSQDPRRKEAGQRNNSQNEASSSDSKRQDAGQQPDSQNKAGSNDSKRPGAEQQPGGQNKSGSSNSETQDAGQQANEKNGMNHSDSSSIGRRLPFPERRSRLVGVDFNDPIQPTDPQRVEEHRVEAVQSQKPARQVYPPVQPRHQGHHGARRVPNAAEVQQEPDVAFCNQPLESRAQLLNRCLLEEYL